MTNLSIRFQTFLACCFFILTALAVIPYLGIQNDEALFATPLYRFIPREFSFSAFHHRIPLMVMTYIGTLKTLIYVPILKVFGGNVWSTRVPVVVAGTLSVFIFFRLCRHCAGPVAAIVAGFLLATDPMFLLTNTVDWGPVTFSLLLLVTGCFFLVRFGALNLSSMRDLALGFFFLGLGLWNKALFFWILAGLAAGSVVLIPQIRKLWTRRRATTALIAFLFGASPFILYNLRQRNSTLKTSAHFNSAAIAFAKYAPLEATIEGNGLMGYFTTETWDVPNPKNPSTVRGNIAWWIARHFGEHRTNWMLYALGASVLLVPWWWRKRAGWFSILFMTVVWLLMAFTRDAGASVHHCILLWPFPQLFVGVAFASIRWKQVGYAAATVVVATNLLVLDKYFVDLERNGAAGVFSDAMFGLSRALPDSSPPDQRIWVCDWGILNTLALTHQGRLNLFVGDPPFYADDPGPEDRKQIEYMLNDADALFIGHVPAFEVMKGVHDRLEKAAVAAGHRKELLQTILDSNGRPVFEIFRIR